MTIEPAAATDLPQIDKLYEMLNTEMAWLQPDMFRPAKGSEAFLHKVLESDAEDILVAREEGQVLGLALVQEKETPPYPAFLSHRYAYLMDLVVDAGHRGRGIGKALLHAVEEWARSRGLEFVELGVLAENKEAIGLYESLGFRESRKVMTLDLKEKGL